MPGLPPLPGMPQLPSAPELPAVPGMPALTTAAASVPAMQELAALQQEFMNRHSQLWGSFLQRAPGTKGERVVKPESGDRRFQAQDWTESPIYDYLHQAYLLNSEYARRMAEAAPVQDGHAKHKLRFLTQQYVDAMAPSNFAATNPEFIRAALDTQGASITQGIQNMLGDLEKRRISITDDTPFEVGRNLAVTPGSVVFENEMMQLIQYAPLTEEVYERPLLIVPPCINKFYIMDLQPESSLVRFAISQGHTVFLVSWVNPKAPQAHFTWEDYVRLGPIKALEVVREITGQPQANVLGFCVGGTMLSTSLAVLRGRGEDPARSLTLMTTLLDFAEVGDLGCLVDETSVAAHEATIGKGGLFSGYDLSQVFSSLRPNDLIWNYVVSNYLKGGKPPPFDLLYWNSDSTNIAGPFLAWYLRHMYLQNELRIPGRLEVLGVKLDLSKLDMPAYLFGAREDHIVPWQSAYMVRGLLGGPTTYALGASGHIAGAINPASKNKRSYWVNDAPASSPDEWLAGATEKKGSWWNHWADWLVQHGGPKIPARGVAGNAKYLPIEPAPGRYVKEKA
ncbi:MAG: class I poly(R)-hydroxyalkanoic acid synthase [Rhodocyclaceae bacterium]|nr:class I poly(R)-hydroxyalkanoic acid synthase [Rhodocyclaceae bacterium]